MRRAEARWVEKASYWRIDVQKDGVRKSFYSSVSGARGKREVEKKANAWLDAGATGDLRFGELWTLYLQRCKDTTGTSNHIKHEQIGRLWLLPPLRHRKMSTITPLMWQECIDAAFKKGLSKKTCMNIRASILQAVKFGRQLGYPLMAPEFLEIPKGASSKEKSVLQPEALRILFDDPTTWRYGKAVKEHHIFAWRFMVLTGLRRGECCGIRKEDIKGVQLILKRSINEYGEETRGKNDNARRTILLPTRAVQQLERQREHLKQKGIISPWVFPDERGQQIKPRQFYARWRKYCACHGFHCSLHELRHTMVSIAQGEVPEALLKQIVGHSATMDTHGVYGHEIDGEKERAAALLDVAFDRILSISDGD